MAVAEVSLPGKVISKWEHAFPEATLIWEWQLSTSRYIPPMVFYFLLESLYIIWEAIRIDRRESWANFLQKYTDTLD